ncbi:MAG: alkaline phosphatase, partial [Rhodobacteraceae bacterium]|nr:alkaline phosphatase [Paracoccaceae bacterium]
MENMMKYAVTPLCSVLAIYAGTANAEMNFNRIAAFETTRNMSAGEDLNRESSAEIIAATEDGMTLVYTDSPLGVVGLIDITTPAQPAPLGNVALDGEPTAVAIHGNTAFVGVNTSENYTAPSGHIAVLDVKSQKILQKCDLGGQPDSVAAAKDGSLISIAIENERDEDLGDGRTGQMPAGHLVQFDVTNGAIDCGARRDVVLTGLAEVSPEDPEPEFVDINGLGETVVTMQESNHMVVVSRDGKVTSHFSAGAVDL